MSLPMLVTDREETSQNSREHSRQVRPPSLFPRRRRRGPLSRQQSRLHHSSMLLSSCSSPVCGGRVNNVAAADEELLEPRKAFKKVTAPIPTSLRRSSVRQRSQSGQASEEETQRLGGRSPNGLRCASSTSYGSTWSGHACTYHHYYDSATPQSLSTFGSRLEKLRRRRLRAESASFSDLTIPLVFSEQEDSSDSSPLLTGIRRERSQPDLCLLSRATQSGSVSTTQDRKKKYQNSTSSLQGSQLYSVCSGSQTASLSQHKRPLESRRRYELSNYEKDMSSELSITALINSDIQHLTSGFMSTSVSKDCTNNPRCVSTGRSDSSEFRIPNAREVFAISKSGRIMTEKTSCEEEEDFGCSIFPNFEREQSTGSGSNCANFSEEERAPAALSPSSDATSTVLVNANATNSMSPPRKSDNPECALWMRECVQAPDIIKRADQDFGDYSYGRSKVHKSLQARLGRISPGLGECAIKVPPVSTYMYHNQNMRKGCFRKNVGRAHITSCGNPIELCQNTKRSFSFDILPGGSKGTNDVEPPLFERSFPSPMVSRKEDGKHLLKVLKATGASGSSPLSATGQHCASPSHEMVSVVDSITIKKSNSTTPLGEPTTVEPQQPFRRKVLFKRELLSYPFIALVGLALVLASTFLFVHNSNPNMTLRNHFQKTSEVLLVIRNETTIYQNASNQDYDTCSTIACKRDGTYIKGLLSWHLDPCDNFYRFVCSRWKSFPSATSTDLKKLDVSATIWDDRSHHLEHSVHTLLQRSSTAEDLMPLKGLFYECMNTRQLDIDDWTPMLELLWLVSLEGFPFSSTPRNSTSIWKVAAKVLKMTGAEPLLSVATLAHPVKLDTGIITVGLPDMLASKGSSQPQTTAFYNSTAFICMTVLKKQRNPFIYSQEVASLASRLEELVYTHTVMAGLPQRRIESLKAQPELSSFLVEIFLNSDSTLYSGSHTEVMVRSPAFFHALLNLVHSTEPYVLMNYLGVRLMVAVAAFAPSSGRLIVQTMVEHQYGRARPSLPHWKLCIRVVEKAIPDLFLHAIQLAYKNHFAMGSVQRLLRSIRQSLAGDLAALAVLDQESRSQALALLNATRYRIFRPSWLTNKEKLESYVSGLPRVVRGQSLRSFHKLHSHSFAERLRRDESDRWQGSAFDHDCSCDGKLVFVPVLLFNFSTFDRDPSLEVPHSGVRLVRCLLQLLLAGVSRATSGGRLWWPDMAISSLAVSQLCFQQYGLLHIGPFQLLQHTAALKPAMDLYQEDKRIDVRFYTFQAYSAVHLFFVYYALSYCQESQSDNATEAASYLTNVPLWNNRLFQETFRCPVDSYMNPSKKCVVWREPR